MIDLYSAILQGMQGSLLKYHHKETMQSGKIHPTTITIFNKLRLLFHTYLRESYWDLILVTL